MKQQNHIPLNLSISSFKNAIIFLILGEIVLSLLFLRTKNESYEESKIERNGISNEKKNLFVLGDSFTKGGYLDINKRITTHLEKSNPEFNLVNMAYGGLVGSDYCDTIAFLIQDSIIDEDDIIIIFWNFNDILSSQNNLEKNIESEKNNYTLFSGYKTFLYKNLNSLFYSHGILLPFTNTYSLAYERYKDAPFNQINLIQNKTPNKIIFVPLPKFNLLNKSGIYTQFQNALNGLDENIILIDILDLFIESSNERFSLHVNDHHPNSEAIFMIFKETQEILDSVKSISRIEPNLIE